MSWLSMPKNKVKAGVQIVEVVEGKDGQRLDNFLSALLKGVPRSLIYRLIRKGQVRINGGRAKPATRVTAGDMIRVPPVRMSEDGPVTLPDWAVSSIAGSIIFEQDDLLVLAKPAGMAVHAGSGLTWGLIDVVRQLRPGTDIELVHRLDRGTSGCLLLAKGGQSLRRLGGLFQTGEISKRYLTLFDGRLERSPLSVDQPIAAGERGGERHMKVDKDGKPAQTTFRLLEQYGQFSFVEAELHTGRSHQIRVHAEYLGTPLAGEDKYAPRERTAWWKKQGLGRIFLHAHQLQIPQQGMEPLLVHAPLPDDLGRVLGNLG
jgi:23S rRNA pseudouridine955/2504/2580 synthase